MIKFDMRQRGEIKLNTDLGPIMQTISRIMLKSIQMNFTMGGRPQPWLPLKSGAGTPLVGSGRLYGTINERSGNNWAEVGAGKGLDYAWIHHRGGVAGRGHKSNIPARPYMVLQRSDIEKIVRMVGRFTVDAPGGEDVIF